MNDLKNVPSISTLIGDTGKPKGVAIKFDKYFMEMICRLIATETRTLRRAQLINIQKYIDSIDPKVYENIPENNRYIQFIRKGLEARLVYNLSETHLILYHINDGMINETDIINPDTFVPLDSNAIRWVNQLIEESLKFECIKGKVDGLLDLLTAFKTNDYTSKAGIVNNIQKSVNGLQNEFRLMRNETHNEALFSLAPGDFEDSVRDAYNQLTSPKRKLITGMQGLNELLGGGFESGRCYMFFGLPGEGKSLILLNILFQLKKYNVDYKCKDPTKKPCVVLLTMENDITESIDRLFSVTVHKNSMIEYDINDVIGLMRVDGQLELSDNSPINIFIKFMPTNSVDTSYLYTLTDDLEDMGYETIAMIQDYIGRIRSIQPSSETRIVYGNIVDEFKTFATDKDIPVISAAQLNRDASKHIDEGRQKNKTDLVRFLGRTNISESILILNNIDAGYVIAPEITREGDKYLGVQRIKIRYKASSMDYVYLPFIPGGIYMMEDFGQPALYKTSMRENMLDDNDCPCCQATSRYTTDSVKEFDAIASSDSIDENIFKDAQLSTLMPKRQLRPAIIFDDPDMNKLYYGY